MNLSKRLLIEREPYYEGTQYNFPDWLIEDVTRLEAAESKAQHTADAWANRARKAESELSALKNKAGKL